MANKRTLKKRIQQLCGAAAVQVMMNFSPAVSQKIVVKLAKLQSVTIANISFGFDHVRKDFANANEYNKAKHEYMRAAYKQLKYEFNRQLTTIVDEINSSVKAQKESHNN